ncbi:Rv3235 family protein [Nocardiopsis dassonvillei]|uniref:Rv3235 family protein n=1 Tax=Nocardiopsis dassonvillei TaxID=2014 RepID=UPI0020A46CD8|nr:Rv3235 family protein [Nocardiopsis dassonvillei]MCP3012633.1 Rv3235 family protein [Nocardiopsis dassonvillei]
MSYTPPRHPCPRPLCAHGAPAYHRPVRTPARTPLPPRHAPVRRCGPPLLAGHRTPGPVHLLAQRVAEVLVGRRTPEALRDQVTVPVREELRRLRGTVSCELAPRLTQVYHQPVDADGVEANAVIRCDRRSRVFAFRARREADGRWVCTRLETDGAVRGRGGMPVEPTG